jgi:hypothetical protein
MHRRSPLSLAGKVTVAGLLAAAAGVVVQIVSGVAYPTIPPVFFILLVPAGLIAFGRWWWTPGTAALAGLFLTFGLFASGSSTRLFDLSEPGGAGGSIGLWIQMLGVIFASVSGAIATAQSYVRRMPVVAGAPEKG